MDLLGEFLGSPVMAALGALSVLALAVILERTCAWIAARRRMRNPEDLVQLAREERDESALRRKAAARSSRNVFARIFMQWLDSEGHRGHVEQAVSAEEALLDRNVWMLECAATVGPLLGILGTLVGISKSFGGFGAIAELNPTVVSQGISLALRSTAVGLIVTIASVVCAHLFRRMTVRAVTDMENFGETLLSVRER